MSSANVISTGRIAGGLALNRAVAGRYPNVQGQLAVQHDTATSDVITSVQVGLPLPIYNANQGNIQKAEAELRDSQSAVRRVELDLTNRLTAAYGRFTIALPRLSP